MAPKPNGSLSELARQLLAAERDAAEPEGVKARAMARARAAFERAQHPGGSSSRSLSSFFASRVGRLPRSVLPGAAALALAGLAAAGATLWTKGPRNNDNGGPSPVVAVSTGPEIAVRPSMPLRKIIGPAAPSSLAQASAAVPLLSLRAPSVAPPPRRPSVRQYALELELLEPARHAIAQGNFGAALDAVARHEEAFPRGQLAEERSALRVRALWASGRRNEAEAAAARFRARFPRSGLLSWMRSASERP